MGLTSFNRLRRRKEYQNRMAQAEGLPTMKAMKEYADSLGLDPSIQTLKSKVEVLAAMQAGLKKGF